jgi:hypothetical protein
MAEGAGRVKASELRAPHLPDFGPKREHAIAWPIDGNRAVAVCREFCHGSPIAGFIL